MFSDTSDVADEATGYFCIDEQPQYRQYCGAESPYSVGDTHNWYQRHFTITDKVRLLIKNMIRLTEGPGLVSAAKIYHDRDSWTLPNAASWVLPGADLNTQYQPLGIEGGIVRSKRNMQALADLLAARHIALTIVVYPHPLQLAENDRDSRQIAIWREFCAANCRRFINLALLFLPKLICTATGTGGCSFTVMCIYRRPVTSLCFKNSRGNLSSGMTDNGRRFRLYPSAPCGGRQALR